MNPNYVILTTIATTAPSNEVGGGSLANLPFDFVLAPIILVSAALLVQQRCVTTKTGAVWMFGALGWLAAAALLSLSSIGLFPAMGIKSLVAGLFGYVAWSVQSMQDAE